jgi:hypothetical protein
MAIQAGRRELYELVKGIQDVALARINWKGSSGLDSQESHSVEMF